MTILRACPSFECESDQGLRRVSFKTLGFLDLTLQGPRTVSGLSAIWEGKPWSGNQEMRDLSTVQPPTWRTSSQTEFF